MGLLRVPRKAGWGRRLGDIVFVLKNSAAPPALSVGATMDFFTDNTARGQKIEPTSVQIFPSDELESIVTFDMGDPDKVPVHQETMKLRVKVRIPYEPEGGRKFEDAAEASYKQGRFTVDKSETH